MWTFDLVGCGESDPRNPDEKGLFIPLDWVRQAESLWREHINKPVVVVAQGGLAPIGVYLASRETDSWSGSRAVRSLILASPPTWEEIAKDSDSAEVERNFRWMASPLGALSYRLLRTRAFVEFFSNLFLFDKELGAADERWLREACDGATLEARWPVLAFNAGLVGCAGLETQLRSCAAAARAVRGGGPACHRAARVCGRGPGVPPRVTLRRMQRAPMGVARRVCSDGRGVCAARKLRRELFYWVCIEIP